MPLPKTPRRRPSSQPHLTVRRKTRLPSAKLSSLLLRDIEDATREAARNTNCYYVRIAFEPLSEAADHWLMPLMRATKGTLREHSQILSTSRHSSTDPKRDELIAAGVTAMMVNSCRLAVHLKINNASGAFELQPASLSYNTPENGFANRAGCVSTLIGIDPVALSDPFMRIYVAVYGEDKMDSEGVALASRTAIANFCTTHYGDLVVIDESQRIG